MLPRPVRVDTNASLLPSGEYKGRDSVAGSEISNRASPPAAGTVQISPPEAKATSLPSGESAGSDNEGSEVCECSSMAVQRRRARVQRRIGRKTPVPDLVLWEDDTGHRGKARGKRGAIQKR